MKVAMKYIYQKFIATKLDMVNTRWNKTTIQNGMEPERPSQYNDVVLPV